MYYTRSVCVTTSTRGFLAVGTKVGAALADGDFFDCSAAAPTGLTGATIRLEVILLSAFGPVAIARIPEGAAAVFEIRLLSSEERTKQENSTRKQRLERTNNLARLDYFLS